MEKTDLDYRVEFAINSTIEIFLEELRVSLLNSYDFVYVDLLKRAICVLVDLKDYNK